MSAFRRTLMALFPALVLALSGCAGGPSRSLTNALAAEPDAIVATHRILVATTRAKADDPSEVYGGGRGDELGFARVDVTVPRIHSSGRLEGPRNGARRDASKHFAAGEIALFPKEQDFGNALRESLSRTDGRALVFVHGYRTAFDGSVYRSAQISHDWG